MSKGLPQLNLEHFPTQIFWLAIGFIVFYFIIRNLALPRIEGAIALRERAMDSDLEEAKRLQKEGFLLSKAYDERLEKARTEATQIIEAKAVEAKNYLSAQESSLQNVLKVKTEQANSQIIAFKNALNSGLTDVVADVTASIINQIGLTSLSVKQDDIRIITETKH